MNKVNLGNYTYYGLKDQAKSDKATCFIGRGSLNSSTHKYMLAWGELANKGSYTADDVVFVSVEGDRRGRLDPNYVEVQRALNAKATIVTDTPEHRARPYNSGERSMAEFLKLRGYYEPEPGIWYPDE